MDMHNDVTPAEAKEMLRDYIKMVKEDPELAAKLPPMMLWGAPGVGKSTVVKSVCKEMGVNVADVRLPTIEAVDVRGCPALNNETKVTEWYASNMWPRENEVGGIIFLDELSAAPKDVQVASYELILDRQLGGGSIYKVPSKWVIVAAGNRSCDRAVSMTMSSALANRMMHLDVNIDNNEWLAWAQGHDVHPMVISFIRSFPKFLLKMDDENLERGYPTPRSWEWVSQMCYVYRNSNEKLRKAVYGLVGEGAGFEFMKFWKNASVMADVHEMMTDPNRPVVIPKTDDVVWAMTDAMSYYIWRGADANETKTLVDGFLRIAMKLSPAFSRAAMAGAMQGSSKVDVKMAKMTLMRNPAYREWMKKFGKELNSSYEV